VAKFTYFLKVSDNKSPGRPFAIAFSLIVCYFLWGRDISWTSQMDPFYGPPLWDLPMGPP